MNYKSALFGSIALVFGAAASAQAQVAHFVAQSATGDYVGQGKSWDLTFTPQTSFQFFGEGDNFSAGNPAFAQFVFVSTDLKTSVSLDFNTDGLQQPLAIGTYTDALPISTVVDGHPSMEVVIDGHQPTTLTGSFTITDLKCHYNTATSFNDIIDFEGSFVQYANGSNAPLTGTFTYHLNQSAVPEPTSMAALGFGALALAARRRRKAAQS